MYKLLRSILFNFNTEAVHHFSMDSLSFACKIGWLKKIISNQFSYQHPSLEKEVFGLKFSNPVGLGAGFDKNALYLTELEALGFGFVEIGTVTPKPQSGNEQPRLFRLPKDKALINRMGFNNDGVEVIAKRLGEWKRQRQSTVNRQPQSVSKQATVSGQQSAVNRLIVGGNIGKNKITPNEDAWKDYELCFNALFDVVDYFVVNVSSPNTPGLRELQEKDALRKILANLQAINQQKDNPKPLLLKIAPDLTNEQLDDIVDLALEVKLAGLVATNTTISRNNLVTPSTEVEAIGMGGLSGKPVQKRSTEVVAYLSKQLKGQIPIIASGGIFTSDDAKEKLEAGATLIQIWTGFVYEGPSIAKRICEGLV